MATTLGSGDATARWVDKAAAAAPEARAAIIEMLGRRGDRAALPFVRESPAELVTRVVRLAAIPAAVRLGGETVISDIFGLFASAGENEAAALKTALLGFDAGWSSRRPSGSSVRRRFRARPSSSTSSAKREPAARSIASSRWPPIRSPRPAAAALGALAKLAGEADLPRLVEMLEKATDGEDIVNLQNAVDRRGAPRRRARRKGPRSSTS